MTWDERIIGERELKEFFKDGDERTLASSAKALIEHQKQTWPLLAEGYCSLEAIETKTFQVLESRIVVQHNPGRRRSTAARVDRASVEARRCFLCSESLPAEEKGIAYGDLVILCNPFPVLADHLSIVDRRHSEQKIAGNVERLLSLTRDLGSDFFVIYNGPQCGASAPDHLHFQACSRKLLPIENDLGADEPSVEDCAICAESRNNFELFTLSDCARSVVVFRGNRGETLAAWIYKILAALAGDFGTEPMINIVATHDRAGWTVYLFPRARHRPYCFYAEGEEQLMISPGAIDMAGVIVVPERDHFERITSEKLEEIFVEVSRSVEEVDFVVEQATETPVAEGWF
ncbi:MAG: DUF4922 domain-containing protein [Acidobacteriota bacterium]